VPAGPDGIALWIRLVVAISLVVGVGGGLLLLAVHSHPQLRHTGVCAAAPTSPAPAGSHWFCETGNVWVVVASGK